MSRARRLRLVALAVAVLGVTRAVSAADSAHFKQTSPKDMSVLPQGTTSVTLQFQIDWAGLKAQYGAGAKVGLSVFFPCCYGGIPIGDWVTEGQTSKSYTVAAIEQAMTQHNVPKESPIAWTLDLHFVPQQSERAESHFFVSPPHRPGPHYAPSLSPDTPTAVPTRFYVTNDGDAASDPSSLTVSVRPVTSRVQSPRGPCTSPLAEFTKDVPVLAPGAKFEIPVIPLKHPMPSGKLPTPLPSKGGGPAPKLTQTVSCQFEIKAETGPRTPGASRPIGVYGSLTHTITVQQVTEAP